MTAAAPTPKIDIRLDDNAKTRVPPEVVQFLERGTRGWSAKQVIVLKFEEFQEVVIYVDDLSLTEEQTCFLACTAAHFGKFMSTFTSLASEKPSVIRALVENAATNPYLRVAWRAALMLEHFRTDLVNTELSRYSGSIRNSHIVPDAIRERKTMRLLRAKLEDSAISSGTRDKLNEVIRQIEDEYGDQSD